MIKFYHTNSIQHRSNKTNPPTRPPRTATTSNILEHSRPHLSPSQSAFPLLPSTHPRSIKKPSRRARASPEIPPAAHEETARSLARSYSSIIHPGAHLAASPVHTRIPRRRVHSNELHVPRSWLCRAAANGAKTRTRGGWYRTSHTPRQWPGSVCVRVPVRLPELTRRIPDDGSAAAGL